MNSKSPSRSSFLLGLLLLGAHPNAFTAQAADPSLFIMGVWPDRLRLFGQTTDSRTASLQGTGRPAMQP